MATEEGVVIAVHENTARIKTSQSTACESCASQAACTFMGSGKDVEIEVINTIGAEVGDTVILEFATQPLLIATFLLYMFPILCLLVGAFIGDRIAPYFNLDASYISAVGGFVFFAGAIIFVRFQGNRLAKQDSYHPTILRIKRKFRPAGDPAEKK